MGDCLSLSHGVLCIHSVSGWDPLGNHVGLPLSMPMGSASEVVPTGYNDGSPCGVTSGGRPSEG
eukprot:163715-Ditylum_brightwellii.AAC.1